VKYSTRRPPESQFALQVKFNQKGGGLIQNLKFDGGGGGFLTAKRFGGSIFNDFQHCLHISVARASAHTPSLSLYA